MITKTREILNEFIPDVWIYSELVKNRSDRFYGLSLFTSNFHVSDFGFDILSKDDVKSPEEIAEIAAKRLLDEIQFSSNLICTNF